MHNNEQKQELPSGLPRSGSSQSFWDRQLRARICQDLRAVLESSLDEPLPERLSSPLLQIEAARKGRRPFDQ